MMKWESEAARVLISDVTDDASGQTKSESLSGEEAGDTWAWFSSTVFNISLGPLFFFFISSVK